MAGIRKQRNCKNRAGHVTQKEDGKNREKAKYEKWKNEPCTNHCGCAARSDRSRDDATAPNTKRGVPSGRSDVEIYNGRPAQQAASGGVFLRVVLGLPARCSPSGG